MPTLQSGDTPAVKAALPERGLNITLDNGDILRWDSEECFKMNTLYVDHGQGGFCGGVWLCHRKELCVIASMDTTGPWGTLLHVSTSCKNRMPRWDELTAIKKAFYGDVDVAMILPRAIDYVNISKNAMHLWQIPQVWGIR